MANADGYVIPKPGVPKTLGILNVIFAVLLILLSLCTLGGLLAAPAGMKFVENIAKEGQAKVEAQHKERLKDLDDRIKAAKTDDETKALEQERATIEANRPQMPTVDMSAAENVLKDPTIMGYTYADLGTGLILRILLLVSGIALIRLSPIGRSLANWWAGLQIAAIIILTGISIAVIQPINKPNTEKQIAKLEADAKAKGPGSVEATTLQMTKATAGMAAPMAVGMAVVGMIYPVIVLILLNTAGARAALLPKRSEGLEGF